MTIAITDWASSASTFDSISTDPAIVLLHGYGSNERDLPGLVTWMGLSLDWASLRAPVNLGNGGFAWFPVTSPLNPSAEDVAAPTEAMWSWIDQHFGPNRPIIAIGFSQGALMASQLLRTRPERICKVAFLAGFTAESVQLADARLKDIRPTVFWARGDADAIISDQAVARAALFFAGHAALDARVYPGLGHSIDERVLTDLRDYLTR